MIGTTEPGPDRWRLGFKEAVLASFGFLRSYALKPIDEQPTFVRYESGTVFVNVYRRASYVEIGRKDRPEKYGLGDLVSWAGKGAREAEGFGCGVMFQVGTAEGVRRPKVAELVSLIGSRGFYDELAEAKKGGAIAYEHQQIVSRIRSEAEDAWHAKDLPRVAELYASIHGNLTEIEAKKLAYAQKGIDGADRPASPKLRH